MPLVVILIVILVPVAVLLWWVYYYNKLIRARNRVNQADSDIDVQLKRRWDLIPNLIESVKGYMKHERETLDSVVKARAEAMKAQPGSNQARQAENILEGALKSLFALAENYPDLKASENYLNLQSELSDTEDKIQAARRLYNATLTAFTNMIQVIPGSIVAGVHGFKVQGVYELFDVAEAESGPVKVSF